MRKRIVINVDAAEGEATRRQKAGTRRRWPRVLALLAVLILVGVVIAAGVAFFWWRNYQTTPEYALASLVHAIQQKDVAELQKLINDDEVAKNLVASVSQKAAGRYGYALNSSIQQKIDTVLPSLLPQLKQTIHEEVLKELTFFAAEIKPKGFLFLVGLTPKFTTVTTEGNTAKVTANTLNRAIELTMRKNAESWQVVEFKDDVVVQRIVDSVMKELPAIGTIDSNNPLLKQSQRNRPRRRR